MATTKLTLSIDEDTIQLAKQLASENNTSLSKFFKKLIRDFPRNDKKTDPVLEKYNDTEIPEWIQQLTGVGGVKVPDNVDYKEMKYAFLKEKYGL